MSIQVAIKELKIQQSRLLQKISGIGKAIQLLEDDSEVQQIRITRRRRRLSPEAIENIRKGAKKRWSEKKKALASKNGD